MSGGENDQRQRIEDLASRYFDQALEPAEEAELAAALRGSAQARELFRELARIEGATALLVSTGLPGARVRRRARSAWWWPAAAVAAVLALAAGALFWGTRAAPAVPPPEAPHELARAQPTAQPQPSDLPHLSRTADGEAIVLAAGAGAGAGAAAPASGASIQLGQLLPAGSIVVAAAQLELAWADGTLVRLAAGARLEILDADNGKHLHLDGGRLHAEVAPQPPGRPLLVDTALARARVVGTRFELASAPEGDRIDVSDGLVAFAVGDQAVEVPAARSALASREGGAQLLPRVEGGGALLAVADGAGLARALALTRDGDTVQLAPGVYPLSGPLVLDHLSQVTITGAAGQAEATVLLAQAGVTSCVDLLDARDCTLSHLTLADADQHLVFCHAEAGCQAPRLQDLVLRGARENFIRAIGPDAGQHVDRGLVEGCRFSSTRPLDAAGFVAYLDISGGQDWTVRGCTFEAMRFAGQASNVAASAILARSGAGGTLCERNRISGCLRGITLGAGGEAGHPDHRGGMVRDNMISRPAGMAGDCGISIANSPGTRVLFNTVLLRGTYPDAIEFRFAGTSGGEIADNLCDGAIDLRNDATAAVEGNCIAAQAGWFADAEAGDLHLVPAALADIPPGVALADGGDTFDGLLRPAGSLPVPGADAPKP